MRASRLSVSGLGLIGLVLVVPSHLATAQDRGVNVEGTPEVVSRLFDCRKIEDPTERLACFDREVAVVEEAEASDALVIADREQIREARKGLFGFSLPKIRLFGGGDDDEEDIDELEAVIASANRARNGKMLLTLEDGARWIQTDNTPILGTIDPGDDVTIEKAALGSYKAKIGRKRAFRVKRLN